MPLPLTPARINRYTRLLRRLRLANCKTDCPDRGERLGQLIDRVKEVLRPEWERQAEALAYRHGLRILNTWS